MRADMNNYGRVLRYNTKDLGKPFYKLTGKVPRNLLDEKKFLFLCLEKLVNFYSNKYNSQNGIFETVGSCSWKLKS